MPRNTACVLMLLSVLPLAGCSGFRSPAASVTEVAITEVSDEAMVLTFAVDLKNPNDAPLELHEFRYRLSVDGTQVYAGRRAGGATLGAAQSQRLVLPAVVPYDLAGWSAGDHPPHIDYAFRGRLLYNAPSTIAQLLFDTGVRRPKSSFSKRGQLRLE
jgi:hypothetical protein